MATNQRVIMLEFNELCPPLMEKFINQGDLPNFAQLKQQSECYITDANESVDNLEPWIQWITVHTGFSYKEHGVYNLGDANKLNGDNIWDILSKKGLKSWVCGSMNVKYDPTVLKGKVLPDPWSKGVEPSHKEFEPYYRFVRANVQEHTNESFRLSAKDYIDFLKFMLSHGLSFKTAWSIGRQLIAERFHNMRWKRVVLMDRLQWDVFKYEYTQGKPAFSTFFLNSVAHYQHKFWRYMEPEKFTLDSDKRDLKQYGGAILYGYKELDKIVGEALKLQDSNTTLVFCTGLSQQPYTNAEKEGGKVFYRPHNFNEFIKALNLRGIKQISPVMSEEFHIQCESENDAEALAEQLKNFTLNAVPMFLVRRDVDSVFSGCHIHTQVKPMTQIEYEGKAVKDFYEVFYRADSVKSGMHHSDGLFWITSRNSKNYTDKLPLTDVMQHILCVFEEEYST